MTIATDGRARARDLADSLQVAAVVGALVVLALPWSTEWKVNDAITSTGWGALNDSTEGYPWFVIVVVAAGVTATILDRRWARRVAAWAASFLAVGMPLGLSNLDRLDDYKMLPAAWTGVALVACCAVAQWVAISGAGDDSPQPPRR